jgi:acetyl esterase
MLETYIHPDTARLLQSLQTMGGNPLRSLPLADARSAAVAMTRQLDLPCAAPCVVADLMIEGALLIPARLYTPTTAEPTTVSGSVAAPVIVYVHGGGWVLGDLDICDPLCRHIATRSGYRVLSIGYRLAPEYPFPAALEDVEAGVRWVATSPAALGRPVTGVALAGDSAGATLIASTALSCAVDAPEFPLALLMLYPATDISRTTESYKRFAEGFVLEAADMHFFADCYAPSAATRQDPRASPLLATDLSVLPATTLLTCSLDVLRDEGRAFAARLALEGVDVTYTEARGQLHGIATMRAAVPSARVPVDRAIDSFLSTVGRGSH